MLAPPISPASEPSARASTPASEPSQHDAARPRASFREEVARSRERDAARATRARPDAQRAEARDNVDGREERVDGDHEIERTQDGTVRERAEADSRSDEAQGSSPEPRSTSEDAAAVEPDSAPSKSETAHTSAAAKASAPEQNALPLYLGWLPIQPAALVGASAPSAAADTGTPGASAFAVDGAGPTLDASANAAPSVPVASAPSASAPAATVSPLASPDVAPIAELARSATATDANVPPAAEVRGAPSGNGAAIADDLPKTAAPAAARLAPAELPAFLEQLEVHIDAPHKSAVVELEPLDLGRLSVELSIEPGNGVRAEVRAERQEGYAAIDARLSDLRNALIERGFASVSVQLSLGFTEHRPRHSPASGGSGTPAVAGPRTLSSAEVRALAPARDGAIDVWA